MAIIWDQVTRQLPERHDNSYRIKSNTSNCQLTLHRSNFAIGPFVKITLALLNSIIILTVDNVLRRFCACGGRIATGTTSKNKYKNVY